MKFIYLSLLIIFCNIQQGTIHAAVYKAKPGNDLSSKVQRLKAGDGLVLAPGDYTGGIKIHNLQGTAQRPITIIASPKGRVRLLGHKKETPSSFSLPPMYTFEISPWMVSTYLTLMASNPKVA